VKRRGALLVGAEANLADARRQIAEAERRTTAAIARAEARGETQSRRADDARSAIDAAPLGADGLLSCDAQCLRRLAGAGPRG
jgi:regulator of protease activity HflC (stomatin/prohibitin superfamily)